jgi:hypothetical protein
VTPDDTPRDAGEDTRERTEHIARVLHDAATGRITPDPADPTPYGRMAARVHDEVVAPLVERLRQAEADRDEARAQFASAIETREQAWHDRDRNRAQLGNLLAQRDQWWEQVGREKAALRAEVDELRESRFRWAEEAAGLSAMLRAMARRSARLKRQRNVWRRIQRDVVEVCGAEPGTPVPVAARALRSRVAALEARLAQAEQQRDEIVAEMSATRGALLGHLDMEWSSVPTAELVDEAFEGAVILPETAGADIGAFLIGAEVPHSEGESWTHIGARLVDAIHDWWGVAAQPLNGNEPGPSEDDPGRIATTLGSQASRVAGVAAQPAEPTRPTLTDEQRAEVIANIEAGNYLACDGEYYASLPDCERCEGTGRVEECPDCDGTGKIDRDGGAEPGAEVDGIPLIESAAEVSCPTCKASWVPGPLVCPECGLSVVRVAAAPSVPQAETTAFRSWLCPNNRCEHSSVAHDVSGDPEDPRPMCTMDGCTCGRVSDYKEDDRG